MLNRLSIDRRTDRRPTALAAEPTADGPLAAKHEWLNRPPNMITCHSQPATLANPTTA